jgi:hypothetical protein
MRSNAFSLAFFVLNGISPASFLAGTETSLNIDNLLVTKSELQNRLDTCIIKRQKCLLFEQICQTSYLRLGNGYKKRDLKALPATRSPIDEKLSQIIADDGLSNEERSQLLVKEVQSMSRKSASAKLRNIFNFFRRGYNNESSKIKRIRREMKKIEARISELSRAGRLLHAPQPTFEEVELQEPTVAEKSDDFTGTMHSVFRHRGGDVMMTWDADHH